MSDNPSGTDMRPEYDLRGGVRGKYYERFKQGANLILLKVDLPAEDAPETAADHLKKT